MLKLKLGTVTYQRNGVAGEGFHAVSFTMRDGHRVRYLVAAVFEARGRVAVIDPAAPCECWRGDNFEPELRAFIADHEAKQQVAFAHAALVQQIAEVDNDAKAWLTVEKGCRMRL